MSLDLISNSNLNFGLIRLLFLLFKRNSYKRQLFISLWKSHIFTHAFVCMYSKLINDDFFLQFEKPGRRENFDYPDMAKEAMTKALADAKIPFSQINQAVVGYVYGLKNCNLCQKFLMTNVIII